MSRKKKGDINDRRDLENKGLKRQHWRDYNMHNK